MIFLLMSVPPMLRVCVPLLLLLGNIGGRTRQVRGLHLDPGLQGRVLVEMLLPQPGIGKIRNPVAQPKDPAVGLLELT